ncbi:MAG: ATP-dependent DNA ligase Cdc17 [Paramarteilia canceri]
MQLIEDNSSRLAKTLILKNYFCSLIENSHQSITKSAHLLLNRVAAPHEDLELGVGDGILKKCAIEITGLNAAQIRTKMNKHGDLGKVFEVV